ncbi:MAG TPA: cyclic nucleotide-binding domain-containing protein, partial [Myxococcales bacterium]
MAPAPSKGLRPSDPPQAEAGSTPPLLEGILRVKVPAEKIQPFLARTALFSGAAPEVIARISAAVVGLECAEGSEIVTADKVNDGIGILFSGAAQVLMPTAGGELLAVEDLAAGDHFGEVGALLGIASPFFVIATAASRVLWVPAAAMQGLMGSVAVVSAAVARRLTERLSLLAAVDRQAPPELVTD